VEVAGEGVLQEVLARAVKPLLLGHLRALPEGPPGQLVDGGVAHPVPVGKEENDIVPDVEHVGVQQEVPLGRLHHLPDPLQNRRAREGVAAHGTYIRLEHA